ncbi:MAG: TetR/AcrR family transcriptional regulator [Alphaproteobacteria bacterium]|nr:TetR/AcrR family transcriptional regulator [Alphaproteobacteria bacterium]
MRRENQQQRRQQIEAAAYALLQEKGYKSTSMLAVAKRAGASNETLYRWYGNKQALFGAMVRANAQTAEELVRSFEAERTDPLRTIELFGPVLLRIVTGERAISLNRAAAGDVHETATLGNIIAEGGKRTILPLLVGLFQRAMAEGRLSADDPEEAAEVYLSLLIGDLQIERVIGVREEMNDTQITQRAQRAYRLTLQIFSPDGSPGTD